MFYNKHIENVMKDGRYEIEEYCKIVPLKLFEQFNAYNTEHNETKAFTLYNSSHNVLENKLV